MLRRCLLLGCAFSAIAHASDPPRIEFDVAPAWKAWSRPGRVTELDLRVNSDVASRVALDIAAGPQTLRTEIELQPGRVRRLQIPVPSAATVAVSVVAPAQRRDIEIAQSESPLLGIGLVTGEEAALEGFHTVALAADDLPRNAAAYSSVDALIIDAPTLGALDPRQLGALLAHTSACGRVVVVSADSPPHRLLGGASGCGGRTLMHALSLADATAMLKASLAANLPTALARTDLGTFVRPVQLAWSRVAAALAFYFAAAALLLVFHAPLPVLLLTPALAGLAALALQHGLQSPSQLVIWSEAASGAESARYQARQQFPGRTRERVRVPIPPQLADSVQPCDASQPMHFTFEASRGKVAFAEFDARLFGQASVCYWGSFPLARVIAVDMLPNGRRELRNAGTAAWPRGVLLAAGRVHGLPALGAGDVAAIDADAGQPAQDTVERTAMARVGSEAMAALWELELGGVAGLPAASKGWLLVSTEPP